jgi:phosphotransferase system HPr-like phosphotransfer protein
MKGFVGRTVAAMSIMAMIAVGTPLVSSADSTASTTTTTLAITTLKQYRTAEKLYLAKLKVINATFVDAVDSAKANYAATLSVATNSAQRISARSTMRLAIANATIARAGALIELGKAPEKPKPHKAIS